jgi:DNA repair protein RecO (recombination protein O)
MPTYSSEAIVLRKGNFSEADQVVTILTRFHGKIAAVAKGVRRIGSRKGGNLDLINHVKLHLAEGKNMDIITEVDLISAWPVIKKDLEKITLAYQIIETVDKFMTENQENDQVFRLTRDALKLLEGSSKPELIIYSFQLKILSTLGFQPELKTCVRCGRELDPEGLALSADLGGLIGPEEREYDVTSYPVSAEIVKAWRYLIAIPLDRADKLALASAVACRLQSSIQYYLEYVLEKELRSPALSKKVKNLNE